MAWKDTLLQASFRGVPFSISQVSRSGQRSIGVGEYPYVAGADLEDLGIGPRRVRVRAVFWGDDYEDRLFQFMSAVEASGVAELIHPVHGSMQVLADTWDDDHDAELVDAAVVMVSFVEHSTRTVVFTATSAASRTDALQVGAQSTRAAADDALARYVATVPAGPLRITVLKDLFSQAKGALGKLLAVTSTAKALLADLDPLIYPRAYAGDLLALVDRAFQGLPFGGLNLLFEGDDVAAGSGLADYQVARRQLDPAAIVLTPSPAAPTPEMLVDAAVVQAHAQIHAATAIVEAAAIVLAGQLDTASLDRGDIEAIANQTRTSLQVALDSARNAFDAEGRGVACTELRSLAWQTLEAARAVINQRPPLVKRASPLSGPVRLVAHALYGDADRATEIVRLNQLGRRLFIERGEALNVYAA